MAIDICEFSLLDKVKASPVSKNYFFKPRKLVKVMHHTLPEPAFVSGNPRYHESIYDCWISDKTRDLGVVLHVPFRGADKVACLIDVECSPPGKARNAYCGTSQDLLRQRTGVVAHM